MKEGAKNGENYVDALAKEHRYAVLTKTGRIQILLRPTVKQLRRRGKRGWHLYGTVSGSPDEGQALMDTVERAVRELEGAGEGAGSNRATRAKGKSGRSRIGNGEQAG